MLIVIFLVPPPKLCVRDILQTDIDLTPYTLTDFQWEKIRTSNYYLKKPTGRVFDLDGIARTLRSKYRVRSCPLLSLQLKVEVSI